MIIIASGNNHKIGEFRHLLSGRGVSVRGWQVSDSPVENASTFLGNSAIKARYGMQNDRDLQNNLQSNLQNKHGPGLVVGVLADDSGIVVPALDGAPGLYCYNWRYSHC